MNRCLVIICLGQTATSVLALPQIVEKYWVHCKLEFYFMLISLIFKVTVSSRSRIMQVFATSGEQTKVMGQGMMFFLIKCLNSAMKPQLRSLEATAIQVIKPQWWCSLPRVFGRWDPSTPVNYFDLQEHTCSLLRSALSCSYSVDAGLSTLQTATTFKSDFKQIIIYEHLVWLPFTIPTFSHTLYSI